MTRQVLEQRLDDLEAHLQNESPVLVEAVRLFRELDTVARRLGLLQADESYATRISWWPLISILGTFSAGKSSFVNHFLGAKLQRTGNQAVDDRFTVIVHAKSGESETLPGMALDADPRFPFYRISEQLDAVTKGEGARIDTYLQMKTTPSERLRGKILIDSPGFDADSQRDAVLEIVGQIVDLSDLVVVMFDARHPEPGAMRDTLQHLVRTTTKRADAGKFLYTLNQIDTAARDDNIEEIVAAWQRCLAGEGLTTGRFYTIYNPELAVDIPEEQRARFERRRDEDLTEIHAKIAGVEVGRAYRIVGALENTAEAIEQDAVPQLRTALEEWKSRVLRRDLIQAVLLLIAGVAAAGWYRGWDRLFAAPSWWNEFATTPWLWIPVLVLFCGGAGWLHYRNRRVVADKIARRMEKRPADSPVFFGDLAAAFRRSTRASRSLFSSAPGGWSGRARRQVESTRTATTRFVQTLNDHFAVGTAAPKQPPA